MMLRIVETNGPFKYQVQKKGLYSWYDIAGPDGGAYFNTLEEAVEWCRNLEAPPKVVWGPYET